MVNSFFKVTGKYRTHSTPRLQFFCSVQVFFIVLGFQKIEIKKFKLLFNISITLPNSFFKLKC